MLISNMNHLIIKNLNEIKKYYKKRLVIISSSDKRSFRSEYKEWINDSFKVDEEVWTLPDLTRNERYENFCRSIKKKIK